MNIKVTPEELKTIATALNNNGEAYLTEVKSLYSSLDALRAGWKAQDAQTYIGKLNEYKVDMEVLGTIIKQYSAFLGKTALIYETAVSENASAAGRL